MDLRKEDFRNPNGVARKTYDIATRHPAYQGKPTNGGARDRDVLDAFLQRPDEMAQAARRLRDGLLSGVLRDLMSPAAEAAEYSALEGQLLYRQHLRRERDGKLRQKKIDQVLRTGGHLACEVCDFDFEAQYGPRGAGYIECHHIVPLHVAGESRTALSDVALICSNCHRMIHRSAPWPTPAELRALIAEQRASRP